MDLLQTLLAVNLGGQRRIAVASTNLFQISLDYMGKIVYQYDGLCFQLFLFTLISNSTKLVSRFLIRVSLMPLFLIGSTCDRPRYQSGDHSKTTYIGDCSHRPIKQPSNLWHQTCIWWWEEYVLQTAATGGKGVVTQWVHCELIVSSESICSQRTHQAHDEFLLKVPINLPIKNPAGTCWVLFKSTHQCDYQKLADHMVSSFWKCP